METVVLGGFTLKQKIGEGGFGTVYLAQQQALDRPAVVKVMRRSLATRRDAIDRFVLEARLASRLDHPCAAHIYAFGAEPDGTLWIAMELVKGTSFDTLLEAGPLPLERVMPMMERLCEAVQTAHDGGIVHRDIKPANVMVAAKGGRLMPKLLDFGIAKQLVASDGSELAAAPAVRAKRASIPPGVPTALERTIESTGEPPISSATVPTRSLTQEGQILGSPPYMAPEQWLDAALVGPWTDQYALALVTYEALTGVRACDGKTIAALAEQHLNAPLPRSPLIPDAVHAVLARAAAKETRDRYSDLHQFVAALRAATGWTSDVDEPVASLRADLRATWIADAPQPISEAIAALAAARSPNRMIERATAAARVIARWLGVLGLANRSRLGRIAAHSATAALDAVRELRRRAPRDEEWLDLVAGLAREFADRPATWPIPELVTWCTDREAVDTLRQLVRGDSTVGDADATARQRASTLLATLENVLDRLAWLLDYEVGREVEGGIELWMGSPSDDRVVRHAVSDGERVVVLDADGARVVSLSPLVQIARPLPAEPEEMFVFSGPSRTGDAALFHAMQRGYEREDTAVWAWLAEHVLAADAGTTPRSDIDDRPPYPGLAAFTVDDRASFVGRERETVEVVNRIRTQPIVAVVGPSGAGKSSFLAAGVIPALPPGFEGVTIRPGRDPIGVLASLAERVELSPYRDGVRLPETSSPPEIAARLIKLAEQRAMTLVLIVDQCEELFTQGASDEQRHAFAEALVAASASSRVHVVLGMRDDFLCRVDELAAWRGAIGRSVQILGVPGRNDLERIVTEPARRRGYHFEDPSLPARMVEEVADRAGALPLLSFAAAALWDQRDRHFQRLTNKAYDQIGGVAGALVQHADGVVDRMSAVDRRLVRLAFHRLLTAEGARIVHGRNDLVAALGGTDGASAIVERLLAARLIISRDDDAGERVEVVHEALTTTWPKLAAWRLEDASNAKLREQLAAAARHWDERERAKGLLWRDEALDELRRWRASAEATLTPVETEFATASETAARGLRRRRVAIVSSAFSVLAVAVVVLAAFNQRISTQRKEAVRRVATSFEERGRLAVADGNATHALLYLTEAARLGATGPGHDLLVARAAASVEALERVEIRDAQGFNAAMFEAHAAATLQEHVARLWDRSGRMQFSIAGTRSVALVGDGLATLAMNDELRITERSGAVRWRIERAHPEPERVVENENIKGIAVADAVMATYGGPVVRLRSVADGRQLALLDHGSNVRSAVFDAAGERLATVSRGELRVYDVATAGLLSTCTAPAMRLYAPTFLPEGRLAFGGDDGVVRICDAATGAIRHALAGHRNAIHEISASDDGAVLASASFDGTVRLWNTATGALIGEVASRRGTIGAIALSPDGRRLATGGEDATIRIWDVASTSEVASLQGHEARILDVRWEAPDRLASASFDGTVRRWNVAREQDNVVAGHATAGDALDPSRDGKLLLSRGQDRSAIVWDVRKRGQQLLVDNRRSTGAAWLNGERLVSAVDGRVEVSSVDGTGKRVSFASGDREIALIATAHDGNRFATASVDGEIRLWGGDGAALGAVRVGFLTTQMVFDPSDRWLVVRPRVDTTHGLVVIDAAAVREVARLVPGDAVAEVDIDETRLAVAHDRTISVFELGSWTTPVTIGGHRGWVSTVALISGGRLVSTSNDSTVNVWDRTGRVLATLPGSGEGHTLDTTADGLLAVGTDTGAVDIWDLTTNRLLVAMKGHRLPVYAVRFSPDGTQVFSTGRDGRVASWDLNRRTRSYAELVKLVKCRVPLRLEGDTALPRTVDFDDADCR